MVGNIIGNMAGNIVGYVQFSELNKGPERPDAAMKWRHSVYECNSYTPQHFDW